MDTVTIESQAKNKWIQYKKTQRRDINIFDIARDGSINEFRALLKSKISQNNHINIKEWINSKNERDHSPLMLAVYNNNLKLANHLIYYGADVNSYDSNGNTILMGAALKGYTDAIKLLIKSGANINKRNLADMTALDWAKMFGRSGSVRLLEQYQ